MTTREYQLSCESTVDLPFSYVNGRGIEVLFYSYTVDGKVFPDDMGRDPEALPRFYRFLREKKLPATSQINVFCYEEYFEGLLEKGDVLHIAFGSGMTPSVRNAEAAAERLREKFPGRRITVIDSTCSSSGYGMLVDSAADLWEKGASMEEVSEWLLSRRELVHHQLFSTDMQHFRRSGRVSGVAAAAATLLGICPLMRLDRAGRIIAYDKVRGKRGAMRETVQAMEKTAQGGTDYDGKCFLCHSDCLEDAKEVARMIEERFPRLKGKVRIFDIGTIVAAHTGQGTVSLFYYSDTPRAE